jgi:hypothetical protein
MARKIVHRPNLPQETLDRARRELEHSGEIAPIPAARTRVIGSAAPVAAPAAPKPSLVRRSADLRQEYTYVLTDLRNMAVLAAAIFAVLIVLSFVI